MAQYWLEVGSNRSWDGEQLKSFLNEGAMLFSSRVSSHSEQNMMTVSNLGMIFGPTLMRSQEETVAAMMNIKFQNIVVEIIIENHDKIFGEAPDLSVPLPQAPSSRAPRRSKAICLSSGKRKARIYTPALCLADNDSDTFSSSPSTTPRGSQESLSSHSSEKNGLSPVCPPSSPAVNAPSTPPADAPRSPPGGLTNGTDQEHCDEGCSSNETSAQLTSSSSVQSLHPAVERRDSSASLSSVKESRCSSRSSSIIQNSCGERFALHRDGGTVKRVPSVTSLKSTEAVRNTSPAPQPKATEPISPPQLRTAYRTNSSSSSSSSSLFPYRLSTSSSLTSLHISEDYKSCHGSVQSLMSLDPREQKRTLKPSHARCGSDAMVTNSAPKCFRNSGSVLSVQGQQRDSSVFSSALDIFPAGRDAKALYSCEAEHSHELSFPQGALFTNVHPSVEPGWLQATYKGKTGLIPENYISYT